MNLTGLLDSIRQQPAYHTLLESVPDGGLGLPRSARPYIIAALADQSDSLHIIITARAERAHDLAEQLLAWVPDLQVLSFANPKPTFYERTPWSKSTIHARLQVLAALAGRQQRTVIVTPARALMQRTIPPKEFTAHSQEIAVGNQIRPDELLQRWLAAGYQPETIVTATGTFSRRGGIIDIFPVAAPLPLRIEFFGDEIESMRAFEPQTQRSGKRLQNALITPAREALPGLAPPLAAALSDWFDSIRADSNDIATDDPTLPLADQTQLTGGSAFPTLEFYLPYLYDEPACLLDYLPTGATIMLEDAEELQSAIEEMETDALAAHNAEQPTLPPNYPLPYVTWDHISEHINGQTPALELGGMLAGGERQPALGSLFAPEQRHGGQLKSMLVYLSTAAQERDTVIVVSRQAERLAQLWTENNWEASASIATDLTQQPTPGSPLFINGALAEGWQLRAQDGTITRLLTDAEIFGWRRPEPRRRQPRRATSPEDFFSDLSPGDFVVHIDYGIGHFESMERLTMGDVEREYLLVTYHAGDRLYVPIHQADRLTRYIGPDDRPPTLSHLGNVEWSRLREKTREDIVATARQMLQLYATRETVPGHAFSPDTPWQHELEASFPYIETEDQLQAMREVKADMEQPRPMDRLICGDVGYGKTEVALRAAFKAVMDGKQVALLVPTTVLAQQHYTTFSERLTRFPVAVENLSRFRSRSQQKHTLDGLRQGTVDIVIGTHRLLQDDVTFKDLGLLIIDEEQRFGVTHKDKLKRMRTQTDILTLTATPIPRTLYMALSGARDISTINTAPEERLPIVPHIGVRDDDLIQHAIRRELERDGQVFYVHNRVQTIETEHARLTRLVPEASIEIGHGQMPEAQLAAVMTRFARGQIDVLLSTSIIESGLDIPNANTLIVDRADRFGLAQLYQIRGRVGRSAARAYAYFFHPSYSRLTPDARARLETIAEQTELGSGFSIAMRDLELRGAGDMLGHRQHGNIATVGFHLYTRMLNQAVRALREQEGMDAPPPTPDASSAQPDAGLVTIDLPIPTFVPTDYIPDTGLRLKLYRRLADLHTLEAIDEMAAELNDRFGPTPLPVQNLLYQLQVRTLGLRTNTTAISNENGQISLRVPGLAHLKQDGRAALQQRLDHNVRVTRTAIWLPANGSQDVWQTALLDILESLQHN